MFKINFISCCLLIMFLTCASTTFANTNAETKITVTKDIHHDVSLPLRYIQNDAISNQYAIHLFKKTLATEAAQLNKKNDLVTASLLPLSGFQGLGVGLDSFEVLTARPDLSASVGMNQYVQTVNTHIAVFDKSTGQLAAGFPKLSISVWTGFGGACESDAKGRMTVKYDQLSNRWVLSQLASLQSGPYVHCIAVSNTEDATGSYNRYAFPLDSDADKLSFGAWSDAYYLAFNMTGPAFFGPKICAVDKDKMVSGQPATMQCKQYSSTQTPLIPADLDGAVPPVSGTPAYFMGLIEPHNLHVVKFHVDFANPVNTTLTNTIVAVSPFTKACRDQNGAACAIQPNTSNQLDVFSNRLMERISYRQFRDYGSMVVNHTIEGVSPKNQPAVRWYEFRVYPKNSSYDPIVYQESSIVPDSKNRFLGSAAIDRFTNIAVAYNVTSSLIYPSIELGYHNYNAQLNTVIIQPLVTGHGSQLDTSEWGNYSSMTVDPVDECTFWYTNEYIKANGSYNWSTFVTKFKLAACV